MTDNSPKYRLFLQILKYLHYVFLFFVIGVLGPKEIKEPIPELWGFLEGTFGHDMTGFWFSPIGGNGNCRIDNAKLAIAEPDTRKIVFGVVSPPNGKPYPHLWASAPGDQILDTVCPLTNPACRQRRAFAVLDPRTLIVEQKMIIEEMDEYHVKWGQKYLKGLKSAIDS